MKKTNIGALLAKKAAPAKKNNRKEHPEIDCEFLPECLACDKENDSKAERCSCGASLNLADHVYGAYKAKEDAEANFATLEAQMINQVAKHYEQSAKDQEFSKTWNVAGLDTPGCQVSYKDQFKQIPVEKEEPLRKALGEKYENFFFQKRELSLKDPTDETINFLMTELGEDKFFELFNVKVTIGTKADMDRKQFDLAPEVRIACLQYAPATKIRKEE